MQQENRENTDACDGPNEMDSNASSHETATEESPVVEDIENDIEINFTDKRLLLTMLEVLTISWISIKRKFDKVLFGCFTLLLFFVMKTAIAFLFRLFVM